MPLIDVPTLPAIHVLPIKDLKEHVESWDCWCCPTVEADPNALRVLIVHNSEDGRELVEQHGVN